ncbi:hypothetical protein [uncultured Microbacterium sp.]|uniref:hypothetical protein n=1 Tax=uncultured Microbacterium sp. TaxID=191216 RepID=UPI0028E8529C|nr:hypothetical protein [uncultured Microbacterium sp.]
MASKNTVKKIETVEGAAAADHLQVVNDGIMQVVEEHNINVQKNRYKAMRAIAWQAFIESIEAGGFDALVERASANVGSLPSGWEINVPAAPAPKVISVKKATR